MQPIPPNPSAVRINLDVQVVVKPMGAQAEGTRMDMIIKANPKISWLPTNVLNWCAQQFVKLLFNNMVSLSTNFDSSPYPKRVEANERNFYSFVKDGLAAWLRGELPEGGSIHKNPNSN